MTPADGDIIEAWVDGNLCGQGTVTDGLNGESLAYVLQINADSGEGCGTAGAEVTLMINGEAMPNTLSWQNSAACYHPVGTDYPDHNDCLAPNLDLRLYLPAIMVNLTAP